MGPAALVSASTAVVSAGTAGCWDSRGLLRVHICRTSSLVHRAYEPTNITGGGNTFPISMGLPEDFGEIDGESSFFLMKTATVTPAYNSSGVITCGGHQ